MELKRFTFSDSENLSKAFEIRNRVFIQEQKVNHYEEFDEYENSSIHYLIQQNGISMGTARWRITDKGFKLERFAVLKEYRAKGVGNRLLSEMLNEVPKSHQAYLHAQIQVVPFYEKHGFDKVGDVFRECEIDHYKMNLTKKKDISAITLSRTIEFVEEFHKAFGVHVGRKPDAKVEQDLVLLRHRLMQEENEEYLEAAMKGDLVEIADALGDMLYILNGTIITHGLQHKIAEIFEEIQRSNMSKLDANGKAIYREDGKVMKSDLYFKPDIYSIINRK